jgi:hypothetical protein
MQRTGTDLIEVEFWDMQYDEDGVAVRSQLIYTDPSRTLDSQDVEDFALAEQMLQGWKVLASGWSVDGRSYVVETHVPVEGEQ